MTTHGGLKLYKYYSNCVKTTLQKCEFMSDTFEMWFLSVLLITVK